MIVWSEQATRQVDQAHDFIALSNSADVATRIAAHILATIEQLETFPMSGRTGRVPGTRELVVPNTPFLVAYAIEEHRILILAIYHGAQKWPEVF